MAKAPLTKAALKKADYSNYPDDLIRCSAYKQLKPTARIVLLEFMTGCKPWFNGKYGCGLINLIEKTGLSENTIRAAITQLQEYGFIEMKKRECRARHQAREWHVTWQKCEQREPTKNYLNWQPGIRIFPCA